MTAIMPGLVGQTAGQSQTFEVCSVRSRRSSSSMDRDDRQPPPLDFMDRLDVIVSLASTDLSKGVITVVEGGGHDLLGGLGAYCPRQADSDRKEFNSSYSTDSDDADQSVSSTHYHNSNSRLNVDDCLWTELADPKELVTGHQSAFNETLNHRRTDVISDNRTVEKRITKNTDTNTMDKSSKKCFSDCDNNAIRKRQILSEERTNMTLPSSEHSLDTLRQISTAIGEVFAGPSLVSSNKPNNSQLSGKTQARLEDRLSGSNPRQSSLEPEARGITSRVSTSRQLQRSKSFPLVSQRALFLPIRPSPEQSGLFPNAPAQAHHGEAQLLGGLKERRSNKTTSGQGLSRHNKQQAHLPVARVNPQTHPVGSPSHQQQQQQQQQDKMQACQLQQRPPCPAMCPVGTGYMLPDSGCLVPQCGLPVIYVPGSPAGYYMVQDYWPGVSVADRSSPAVGSQLHPSLPAACVSELPQTSSTNNQPPETGGSTYYRLGQPKTGQQEAFIRETNSSRSRDSPLAHGDREAVTYPTPSQTPGQKPSTPTKKKQKKPLLPDPLIPKFSDMVAAASSSSQYSLYQPTSQNYHSQPPLPQQQQQQSYSAQAVGNSSSVFHVNQPVFLQQVPYSSFPMPPTGVGPSGQIAPSLGLGCHNTALVSHSTAEESSPPSVSFMVDHSGLIIYGPQPPSVDTPAGPPSQSSPSLMTSTPTSVLEESLDNQLAVGGNSCHGQPLYVNVQWQQPSPNLVCMLDSSGQILAVNSCPVFETSGGPRRASHQEVPGVGVYQSSTGSQLTTDGAVDTQSFLDSSPATVRMVSSNGPPVPMPMQVPPGHMVQQIVDEHGILTHVILSPQPPAPGAPMTVGPYAGPGSGNQYYTTYGTPHYVPTPAQYPHHPHPMPPHMHVNTSAAEHIPLSTQGEYGISPPLNSPDDRALRMRNKVRKKLQRRVHLSDGFYPNAARSMGGRRNRIMGINGDNGMHGEPRIIHGHCPLPQENGSLDVEEENSLIIQCLSSLPLPKVADVEARSSLVQLSHPDCESYEVELDPYELKFELLLSDKGRDAKYKTVFCGDASEITLKDLKPATEYHLKVCAVLTDELKGALTEPVSFQTLPCAPDCPQPPRLISKTKTSLSLKWNVACENGSKITTYCLESDQGQGDGRFYEVYSGLQRQCRITRLNASMRYVFRLAAINSLGKSPFSDQVSYCTSGSSPSQPDPPMLSEQFVYSLTISWIRRLNDDEFLLQMEDESTGHGFIPVYNGTNLSTVVKNLRRFTEYKFRLAAKNEEGQSKWSEVVCFKTLSERPQPPSKPQIKGKMNPYSFRITWDPPMDTGGTDITKYIVELDDGQGYDTVYEGSEREHTFDHLTPGHVYHVRVACCTHGGRSDFSDCCVATTLPVAPSRCQAPKLQGKPKATSLHLRWAYPDGDGGAQVMSFAAQMISPDNTAREVYKGHDRDCIVTGLLPGRPYLFQVRAFNRAGAGPWSEPLEVVSGAGVPDTPKAPYVSCRSAHAILVNWEEPFNNGATITEYRLEWQHKSDSSDFTQLYVGPNQSFEVKGLVPATMYNFRIQAINSAGPSQFSTSTPCVTPPSSPSAILTVRVKANTTSALLSWQEPSANGSEISSYNICINDKPAISVDPVTEYLLQDLLPETTYKIRVQAVNGMGVGPFSSVVKCTTKALPPSPPALECVLLAPTSIKLKWGEGRNSDLLTYTLEMEKEDGNFQPIYTGPAHMHKVTRLSELTSYEFRIFASNDAGSGAYSDTYTFTTSKTPPPPMKAPKVRNLTPHSCLLEWQAVRPMGGDSLVYVLQLLCLAGKEVEYRQVYKGSGTQFQLDSLQPQTEYQARVAAIRLSCDSSGEILGAFSPGAIFSPPCPEVPRSSFSPSGEARGEDKKPWTDQHYAAILLCLFVLLAIFSAFVCQQLISHWSADLEDLTSSAAAAPAWPS